MYKPIVKIRKNYPEAKLPSYETEHAAGADLTSIDKHIISPRGRAIIDTGLSFEIEIGYEVQIRPRSGLAAKNGITVLNSPGTIDADYRGPIKVILYNITNDFFTVEVGDRIAQMVVSPVERANFEEVLHLKETVRGDGGLGSTGV